MFGTDSSPQCSRVEDFFQAHSFQDRTCLVVPGVSWAADPRQMAVAPHRGASDARAICGHRGGAYGLCDRLDSLHSTHCRSFVFPRAILVAWVAWCAKRVSAIEAQLFRGTLVQGTANTARSGLTDGKLTPRSRSVRAPLSRSRPMVPQKHPSFGCGRGRCWIIAVRPVPSQVSCALREAVSRFGILLPLSTVLSAHQPTPSRRAPRR